MYHLYYLYHLIYKQRLNNSKFNMGWYQTQSQQAKWRSLLTINDFSLTRLIESDLILQQIKISNPEVMAFFEKQHQLIFTQALGRCLVLPAEKDANDRKYKQPTQAINFLQMVLGDAPNSNPNIGGGLPNSSMSQSLMPQSAPCYGRITSPVVITSIIDKTFKFFMKNQPNSLINTLIPGYFEKMFEMFNKNYSTYLIEYIKSTRHIQQLIQKYSKFEQCIKLPMTLQSNGNRNLNMSVSMSMSSFNNNCFQPNYPYQIKFKLLMCICRKIEVFAQKVNKNKQICIEECIQIQNFLNLLIQILKKFNTIFEGTSLTQKICSDQNIQSYFKIANISTTNKNIQQHELKALQLLKYVILVCQPISRSQIQTNFTYIINQLSKADYKPTLQTIALLQLIIQWLVAQFNLAQNMLQQRGVQSSCSLSLSNSSMMAVPSSIPSILAGKQLVKALIRKCVEYPNLNILHHRVFLLISVIFRTKNEVIINSVYKENNIIEQVTSKAREFKKNGYFGCFYRISEVFTKQRIDTKQVMAAIQTHSKKWEDFYKNVLQPHAVRTSGKCGEMDCPEPVPSQFTVDKQHCKIKNTEISAVNQALPSVSVEIQKITQIEEQVLEPITIKLDENNNNEQQNGQNEPESFQSFLKKKMEQSQIQLKQQRKTLSKTPTKSAKLKSASSKKKKWCNQFQQSSPVKPAKKSLSLDQKHNKIKSLLSTLPPVKVIRMKKENRPKQIKQRKLSQIDARLIKWLSKIKQCSAIQAVR